MLNSAAVERITRSARCRSFCTSPVDETKTRIAFLSGRLARRASLIVGMAFISSPGLCKRRAGSFFRST